MGNYGYMFRKSYCLLRDGKTSKGEVEKIVARLTGMSSRYGKDATEDARQIVKSCHEKVKDTLILRKNRLEASEEKLSRLEKKLKKGKTELEKASLLFSIKGVQTKVEKRQRKVDFYQNHKNNQTFPEVIFGGKKNFYDRCKGKITKEQWWELRNGRISSRGDREFGGNPNLRVIELEGKWFIKMVTDVNTNPNGKSPRYEKILLPLYIAEKKSKKTGKINGIDYVELMRKTLDSGEAYEVEIRLRNGKFQVSIVVNEPETPICTYPVNGYVGIDNNPNGLALSKIKSDGNPVDFSWIGEGGFQDFRTNKRKNRIGEIAKEIILTCKEEGTPLVKEGLNFVNKKELSAKFNRMSHQFCYKKIMEAIDRNAKRYGVEVIDVKPAFTSIIGRLKYQPQYGISVHQSAALVIARRGMFQDRKESDYESVPKSLVKLCIKEDKREGFYKMNNWTQWSAIKKSIQSKLKKKGKYLSSWLDFRKQLLSETK